ncbi:Uncharacterized protein TCM_037746 [Theobroma cacao]|uniref:RNase H type-1 domain-containing protein n=1 Tax=Theobroma cacao TaxID=3641 RepID=A0A061GL40_THECC|nr:Uncharacterized protein TCM_037746 [Theobroma cacao]
MIILNVRQQVWTKSKEGWDNLRRNQEIKSKELLIAWKPLSPGYVKLNADGSARGQPGLTASGGLIRDEAGHWILGFNYKLGISFALNSELWGLYRGLKICWNKSYRKVQVESDSLLAIQKNVNPSSV